MHFHARTVIQDTASGKAERFASVAPVDLILAAGVIFAALETIR